MTEPDGLRVDKWLWHARFFKTRALAAKAIGAGLRLNGQRTQKAHALVRPGDTLTFRQGKRVRVIEILGLSERRGSAPEASLLYLDLEAAETGARDTQPTQTTHRDQTPLATPAASD